MTTATTNAIPSRHAEAAMSWVGDLARKAIDLTKTLEFRLFFVVLMVVVAWGIAIATFGYPALILPALCLVPTMFVVLLLITVGK